jgi:hypothetical protein
VCWEEHLSRDELLELLKEAHRRFYFRPRFVLRQLRQLQTRQELKRLTNGALSLLKLELTRADSDDAPV